jgi:hypothetical protein
MRFAGEDLNPKMLSPGALMDANLYYRDQNKPIAPSFDPSQLIIQPNIQPGMPGYNPFRIEKDRDRFILNNPRSGIT